MASSTVALIILACTVVLFVSGKLPISITAVSAAIAMALFGVIDTKTAFAGFSNDSTMMLIGAMIMGEALFETGVAELIGKTIIRMVGSNEKLFIVTCVAVSAILSAFLSNTAVVAMMLPIVAATAANSRGAITKKNSFMAIGFAANVGGGMTLIGSPPNVVGQGLLSDAGVETMSFFDLTLGSIPRLLYMIIFFATIGVAIQDKVFNFPEVKSDRIEDSSEAVEHDKKHMIIVSAIVAFMVYGFVTSLWTVGTVSMITGILCIITGCISVKQAFQRVDWNTVWVLAGALGLASGVSKSGAGQLIAEKIIGIVGGNLSQFALMVIFSILAVILGNLMSSAGAIAIIGPVAISLCQTLGYECKPVIMAIIWCLNLAFLTPISTPPITMTLQAGYRFTDYTKVGSLLLAGSLILTIAFYPILFNLA